MGNAMVNGLADTGGHIDALLRPVAQSIGDMMYFKLIYDFLRNEIQEFGLDLMASTAEVVGASALILMTLWVFFQGLRIVTGTSRDSMMALVITSLKATLIVVAATTFGMAGRDAHDFLTVDMKNSITEIVTGEENITAEDLIDDNLAWMQLGLSSIDALQVLSSDPNTHADKTRAMWMVGAGTAGPAMVGGAMLLMYEVAMALFVGLGPLFILCLLFDATKSLFQRWLLYGIGTMFSLAVLAAMVAIATKTVLAVAEAFWATALVGSLLGTNFSSGFSSMALQQGGIGLLLTVLLISVPPMAATFFQGMLGNFSPYAQVTGSHAAGGGGWGGGRGQGGSNHGSYYSGGRDGGRDGRDAQNYGNRGDSHTAAERPNTGMNNPANAPYGTQGVQRDEVRKQPRPTE